jgi:hypothetical protein
MLVYESMYACISVCTIAKSSIHCSTHPIPFIEFSPTNNPKDEGKPFVHSIPLDQVHIIYTSVTKLLLAERLILLHLLCAMDGNVITIRDHRNIIMCKIEDRPPSLMRWRHEGWRPCGFLWSITRVWARASTGWARQERSLQATYQFLHPAQYWQQQYTTRST